MRSREDYYGPVVPVRTQMRIAPWFLLAVVVWGYCTDHNVHSVQGFVAAVVSDLGGLARPAAKPPADASATAKADIPRAYLAAYQRAARSCPGLSWTVLAAVGKAESDHGRSRLPGVHSGANSAGAAGPMQIGVGGKAGDTWAAYGDGVRAHVYQIGPAARAAARKLCRDGARSDVSRALYAYNHSRSYVDRVRSIAGTYQKARSR